MKLFNKKRDLVPFTLLPLVLSLVACNEGISGVETDDTVPEDITLITNGGVSSYCPAQTVTTDKIQISGVNKPLSVSVVGGKFKAGNWEESAEFVSSGTIAQDDSLIFELTAPDSYNQNTSYLATVGGKTTLLEIKTHPNLIPDPFEIKDIPFQADANTQYISEAFIVSGLDAEADIRIENGAYSINDGPFLTDAGKVSDGDEIRVQVTTAPEADAETTATVFIGTEQCDGDVLISESFYVNNGLAKPQLNLAFPPKTSMTTGDSILVRGSASDADASLSGEINKVEVKNTTTGQTYSAQSTDNFTSWQVEVPLETLATHSFEVIVTDADGQTADTPSNFNITRGSDSDSFPEGNNLLALPSEMAIDLANDRIFVIDRGPLAKRWVYQIDLNTAEITPFVRPPGSQFNNGRGLAINNSTLYVSSWQGFNEQTAISQYDITQGPVADGSDGKGDTFAPSSGNEDLEEMLVDKKRDRIITVDSIGHPNGNLVYRWINMNADVASTTGGRLQNLTDSLNFAPEGLALVPKTDNHDEMIFVSRHANRGTTSAAERLFSFSMKDDGNSVRSAQLSDLQAQLVAAVDANDEDAQTRLTNDIQNLQAEIKFAAATVQANSPIVYWNNDTAETELATITSMDFNSVNDELIVAEFVGTDSDEQYDRVHAISLDGSKTLRIISDSNDGKANPMTTRIDHVSYSPQIGYLFATDFSGAVYAVDIETGARVYLSRKTQ
ncbi:hypothetical protein [Catenovulum adriaticum]|uniref:Uncharacterized protein n=1 Tax=Catenovulum adriaticum TaxID=2984846 RepID=A0ABY7AQR5_9ALTE|nr:hypothetical protein [Catenovulum sp. TS8]WAJ71829.1 hypothetical protein OLW01_15955 [Catenovulum sp. TS8]